MKVNERLKYKMVVLISVTMGFIGLFMAAFILRDIIPAMLHILKILLIIYVIVVPSLIYVEIYEHKNKSRIKESVN